MHVPVGSNARRVPEQKPQVIPAGSEAHVEFRSRMSQPMRSDLRNAQQGDLSNSAPSQPNSGISCVCQRGDTPRCHYMAGVPTCYDGTSLGRS